MQCKIRTASEGQYPDVPYRSGRWRSLYILNPSSSSISGSIKVDVHYFEDGNVRMTTNKPVSISLSSTSASEVVRQIALAERKYQEDLNRAFTSLNEGAFKGLRRQLPVTRQKVEWEKISSYKVRDMSVSYGFFSLLTRNVGGARHRWWQVQVVVGLETTYESVHARKRFIQQYDQYDQGTSITPCRRPMCYSTRFTSKVITPST